MRKVHTNSSVRDLPALSSKTDEEVMGYLRSAVFGGLMMGCVLVVSVDQQVEIGDDHPRCVLENVSASS